MSNKVIYTPKGLAAEYSDLAVNLFTGCLNGCTYCYVPNMLRNDRENFHATVAPRKDILKKLEREAPLHRGEEVFMCFTCDPYPPFEQEQETTRQAIRILHAAGVGVNILTKSGMRACRDFDLLVARPELSRIGATLTFSDADKSAKCEPLAASPRDRMRMLYDAHVQGIKTWASLEPVIEPEETLRLIQETAGFVGHYKIGKWNYDKRANEIDWADFVKRAEILLNQVGASYYLKKDLAVYSEKTIS